MKRRVYLEYIKVEEAYQRLKHRLVEVGYSFPIDMEKVDTQNSLNRVTSEPVFAKISSPSFHASSMDGVAVRAEETIGALETSPKKLELEEQAVYVDTGDPIPNEFDAVIMVEDINKIDDKTIEIYRAARPWQHIRPLGEDIVSSELVLTKNHLIRPVDIGSLLAAGVEKVDVRRQPKVVLIPTGTELSESVEELDYGKVIESNSSVLKALIIQWGGQVIRYKLTVDDYKNIKDLIIKATGEGDIIIVNAGTSAGREDFTAPILEEEGKLLAHGVSLKPGKTVVLGEVQGKPVMGFSGYPVANYNHAQHFLKRLIEDLLVQKIGSSQKIKAYLSRKLVSTLGLEENVQVRLGKVGSKMVATPISRGSGVTMSLVRSDGSITIQENSEGFHQNQEVEVDLNIPLEQTVNNILAVGSHDITLDLLANFLREKYSELNLASANVGSLAGIMAIKRGQAHLAGSHLLDEKSGLYNVDYLKRYLAGKKVELVTLSYRQQGLFVKKGNPKSIKSLKDLTRADVKFINRQIDSGTRVLLDYLLKKEEIDPVSINGYAREVFTHTSVAAAVSGNSADVGLGIMAAAQALDVDFIPVSEERYDLVFLKDFYESDKGQAIMEIINSKDFQNEVKKLGGYDLRDTGKVVKL